jgi:SAM-dependent methyltransferase
MTAAPARDARPAPAPRDGVRLVHTLCPLCGADQGEPVAVGSDSTCGSSREIFLALGCPECGLVYLNPRPRAEDRSALYPATYFSRAEGSAERVAAAAVRRLVRQLGSRLSAGRVLEIGHGPRSLLASHPHHVPPGWTSGLITPHSSAAEAARRVGLTVRQGDLRSLDAAGPGYDLVLLFRALEHWDTPVDELRRVGRMLRPGGRALVLTPNPESAAARAFRGRHWAGYDFPRHPCLFRPGALRRLAETAGLQLERLGTLDDARVWAESAASFLRDWEAPGWLVRTGPGLLALARGTASLLRPGRRRDAGEWLEAVLRKPEAAA